MEKLNNWSEFIDYATNKGNFEALVSDGLLNEMIDRQVEFKTLDNDEEYTTVKVYE